MSAAVDWLDAYRAGDMEIILAMYAEDAVVHCGCGGIKIITSNDSLRAFWVDRLRKHPASHLTNLQPSEDGAVISYATRNGVVSAAFTFNASGQIASHTCGPSN